MANEKPVTICANIIHFSSFPFYLQTIQYYLERSSSKKLPSRHRNREVVVYEIEAEGTP